MNAVSPAETPGKRLKSDLFGEIRLIERDGERVVLRDSSAAAPPLRAFARWMLRREARALALLEDVPGVPRLLGLSRSRLERSFIEGAPLNAVRAADPAYFRSVLRLLRRLHRAGLVHNDLAKEPNLLVDARGQAALIDFQVSLISRRRSLIFRVLGREDLRHVLKHKRSYCPHSLTRRQQRMLDHPSLPSRLVRRLFKPVYLLITRRLLGWADREGAERNHG